MVMARRLLRGGLLIWCTGWVLIAGCHRGDSSGGENQEAVKAEGGDVDSERGLEERLGRVMRERDKAVEEKVEAIEETVRLEKLLAEKERQLKAFSEQVEAMRVRLGELAGEVKELTERLQEVSGAEGVGNLDSQASPGANRSIEGVVRYVRDDIVGLGIGSADGVRTGDEFTVHKRATYVGRVRVVRVESETSEAVELREWRNDSERPIREGDSVTNTM